MKLAWTTQSALACMVLACTLLPACEPETAPGLPCTTERIGTFSCNDDPAQYGEAALRCDWVADESGAEQPQWSLFETCALGEYCAVTETGSKWVCLHGG